MQSKSNKSHKIWFEGDVYFHSDCTVNQVVQSIIVFFPIFFLAIYFLEFYRREIVVALLFFSIILILWMCFTLLGFRDTGIKIRGEANGLTLTQNKKETLIPWEKCSLPIFNIQDSSENSAQCFAQVFLLGPVSGLSCLSEKNALLFSLPASAISLFHKEHWKLMKDKIGLMPNNIFKSDFKIITIQSSSLCFSSVFGDKVSIYSNEIKDIHFDSYYNNIAGSYHFVPILRIQLSKKIKIWGKFRDHLIFKEIKFKYRSWPLHSISVAGENNFKDVLFLGMNLIAWHKKSCQDKSFPAPYLTWKLR